MLKNNLLEDRLNKFKNGNQVVEEKEDKTNISYAPSFTNTFSNFLDSLVQFSFFLFKVFIYGIGVNIIFKMGLNFSKYICIGFFINFLLEYVYNITRKL
jgi:hypothetical protein